MKVRDARHAADLPAPPAEKDPRVAARRGDVAARVLRFFLARALTRLAERVIPPETDDEAFRRVARRFDQMDDEWDAYRVLMHEQFGRAPTEDHRLAFLLGWRRAEETR